MGEMFKCRIRYFSFRGNNLANLVETRNYKNPCFNLIPRMKIKFVGYVQGLSQERKFTPSLIEINLTG